MNDKKNFIVVDDDKICNTLCRITIKSVTPSADVQTFVIPEEGFKYISDNYSASDNPTILLLDINMPSWSGWDFLDNFENLEIKKKEQIEIHMLSSSIDPNDKKLAAENKNVRGFIEKPLTKEIIRKLLADN